MITRNFTLYLNAGHAVPLVINVNQYDVGEQWVFSLINGNGVKYTPSTGAIVGIKSDGLGIINSGSVNADGDVVINETKQMTAAVGKNTYELLIDDQTHGTANFIVLVEPKPGDQADFSESDLSLLQQAIDGTSATAIAQGVSDWMDDNLTPTTPVVDQSLTVSGAAADAKKAGDEISDLKNAITNVRTDIGAPFVDFTPIDGKYIFNHTEKSGNAFSRSNPIAVSKGDIVEFTATGYSNSVAMIATCNAEGTTFTDAVRCTDGNNEHTYTYTATADDYIVVSYDHRQPHTLIIKGKSSNITLNSRLTALEAINPSATAEAVGLNILVNHEEMPITVGNFVNGSGVVRPNANFGMSNPVSLNEGDTIAFNAMGYLQTMAILAKVSNGVYTPLIISADSDEHDFSYTADTAMSVVVSTHKNVIPDYTVSNSKISNIEIELKNIENDFFAFATMGVIGDSLASGASNYTGGAEDRPVYSWGKYIEREHGIAVSLFSFGGATTRSWLANNRGRTALLNGDILDCYIIGLGVNDAYSLGAEYLGTISDVNVGNEDTNADTYYGNYSRVIAAIKQKSPRAKIFCLTNPNTSGSNVPEFNSAIADIIALYTNVYLIDLTSDAFYQSVIFNETWNVAHSTAVGYKLISENLYRHIGNVIKSNVSEFTDIQWIAENHA